MQPGTDGIRLRDHYDWIVLGDHPGALLSASLAARLGLSVLILPLVPGLPLTVSKSGQYLDPEPNFVLGLGRAEKQNGLLLECLIRAGITPSEGDLIQTTNVFPQIATPGSRVAILSDDEKYSSELSRELGKDLVKKTGLLEAIRQAEPVFSDHWLGLPKRLIAEAAKDKKKQVDPRSGSTLAIRELSRHPLRTKLGKAAEREWLSDAKLSEFAAGAGNHDFLNFGRGFWYGVTSAAAEDPSLSDLLHTIAIARSGASFKGGMTAYRDFLVRLARRLGAHAPVKGECKRIFIENGRFVGIQISNKGNMISASASALGSSLRYARDLMTESGRSRLHRLKASPKPNGWRFTVALTVHAEAIPPGMSSRLIWQEPGAPVLEIEVVNPADFGLSGGQSRYVFLRTMMPFAPESLEIRHQRLTAARMLRQATELIPFLEFHVTRIYPDFRAEASASDGIPRERDELSEIYGFSALDLIPENLRTFSQGGVGSYSGIEGLFLASGESYPQFGSLGGTVAAVEAVAWLAHRSGLPGPFA